MWDGLLKTWGVYVISLVHDLWILTVFLFAAAPACSAEPWLQKKQGVSEDLMSMKGGALGLVNLQKSSLSFSLPVPDNINLLQNVSSPSLCTWQL